MMKPGLRSSLAALAAAVFLGMASIAGAQANLPQQVLAFHYGWY
jgi:hypothetical protein